MDAARLGCGHSVHASCMAKVVGKEGSLEWHPACLPRGASGSTLRPKRARCWPTALNGNNDWKRGRASLWTWGLLLWAPRPWPGQNSGVKGRKAGPSTEEKGLQLPWVCVR